MKELLFVIPMKDPSMGKSRLSSVLPAAARTRLAMALFRQLLGFLKRNQPGHDILVVTGSEDVAKAANGSGALILNETATGLNKAVTQAAIWAKPNYKSICILPADLADPEPADLVQLLQFPRDGRSITIIPSHDGGTNGLIASPPDVITFRYGPGSSLAHQLEAEKCHATCTIAPLLSFIYDIDTSADLHRLRFKAGEI